MRALSQPTYRGRPRVERANRFSDRTESCAFDRGVAQPRRPVGPCPPRRACAPYPSRPIGAVLALNALIGFLTELKAARSIEALRNLGARLARVRRDGHARLIPADLSGPSSR